MTYLNVGWTCGEVAYSQKNCRMTAPLTPDSLGNISWVQKATLQLYRRNVPLLTTSTQCVGMSLHVISFTRPSPTLILQVTNAGVRRPGYEATDSIDKQYSPAVNLSTSFLDHSVMKSYQTRKRRKSFSFCFQHKTAASIQHGAQSHCISKLEIPMQPSNSKHPFPQFECHLLFCKKK